MLVPSRFPLQQVVDRQPLTATPEMPVTEVVRLMSQSHTNYILIVNQQSPIGIFTERDAVKLAAAGTCLQSLHIADVMTAKVISLKEADVKDIVTLLSLFRQHRIRHLPIVNDDNQLVGIITHESIRVVLRPADLLSLRRVFEVMTTKVLCASVTTSVFQLAQLMTTHLVSCVVIALDEAGRSPVGIVTESDIVRLQAQNVDLDQTQAQSVMSGPLLPIHPQDSLWSAHELMQQRRIRRLVVVEQTGELVGIITQTSLLQVLDPMEAYVALEALQQVVDERTISLRQANEQLQQEITERKKAEEILQQQTERERLIAKIAQHIRRSLNLDEILNTTVAQIRQFLQADRVLIYRFESSNWDGVVAVESVAPDWLSLIGIAIHDNCFIATHIPSYQQGQVQVITDINTAGLTPDHLNLLRRFQVQAKLVVPILQADQLWGMLVVHHCSAPRIWQRFEIDFLKHLADHVAIAIHQSELYQQLEHLASSDSLTQVANRRRFDEYLDREWLRMAREQSLLSLILCDIDFFKAYNDTYGHPAGDCCLRQVASAISQACNRPADLVARYGGEEFAVILPHTDMYGAIRVAEKIQAEIKALQLIHAGSQISQHLTVSLGVSTTLPSPDFSPATLIAAADQGLYQAKAQGRNWIAWEGYQGACALHEVAT